MNLINISYKIDKSDETIYILAGIESRLRNLSLGLLDVGKYLMHFFAYDVIESQGSVYGNGKWRELNLEYKKWKDAKFPGRPILELRGVMRYQWKTISTASYMTVYNDDWKAPIHEFGMRLSNGAEIPARPMIQNLDEIRRAEINRILLNYIITMDALS